jgi:hypothetical protein
MRVWLAVLGCIASLALAHSARADQRRDFMLERPPAGSMFILDYFGTGGQLTLEQRVPIYGAANEAVLAGSTMLTYPFGQVTGTASLRILFLELGTHFGYRTQWRNLTFEPGENGEYCLDCDRKARRSLDPILGHGPNTSRFAFFEGRVQLYIPFNEHVVFSSFLAARFEDSPERTYDWVFATVKDGGVFSRWETFLFFKHRDWGGIGPYTQLMSLPRDGQHDQEFSFGFNAMTRLGLVDRNDMVFFTFLIQPGNDLYGQHTYFSPVRAILVYRLYLAL